MSDSPASSNKAAPLGGVGASSHRMKGAANFVRSNPKSDRFSLVDFDHVELWCTDAKSTAARFCASFGFHVLAKCDIDNGCFKYTAVLVGSATIKYLCVAPYFTDAPLTDLATKFQDPLPNFDTEEALAFVKRHGSAVRAIGVQVDDAAAAYKACTDNGGKGTVPPTKFSDPEKGDIIYCEVAYYDDVRFRYVQGRSTFKGVFLPGFKDLPATLPDGSPIPHWGFTRIDHIVSNVPNLCEFADKLAQVTGMHEFAEFTAEDVGTVDSGLNSMVMANNSETILLPINEPTTGTRRKSQIQSFLDHHRGPGVQHIAMFTTDIIATAKKMQAAAINGGGVSFMPHPGKEYYTQHVTRKMEGVKEVTPELIAECDKHAILIDRDDEGTLLQVFTQTVLDRPTLFIEVIQRLGCMNENGKQKPACGGFGKGNFGALFKSIETQEKIRDGEIPDQQPAAAAAATEVKK